jgi:hypothetical protein
MNANPVSTKKTKKNWLLISILLIIVLCCISCFGSGIYSYREFDKSAKIVENVNISPVSVQPYALSDAQQEAVDRLGYPDSFTITFYYEEFAPENKTWVREETWRYYHELTAYDFYNGTLQAQTELDSIESDWLPAQYTPDQFAAFANLQEVLNGAQIHDYFEIPLEDTLVKNGRLYFAPGLTFGLADGELTYVETITMIEQGGSNE